MNDKKSEKSMNATMTDPCKSISVGKVSSVTLSTELNFCLRCVHSSTKVHNYSLLSVSISNILMFPPLDSLNARIRALEQRDNCDQREGHVTEQIERTHEAI